MRSIAIVLPLLLLLTGFAVAQEPRWSEAQIRAEGERANVLADQDRLSEAIAAARRAVEGAEEVLGPAHGTTLVLKNNLGSFLDRQGRPEEALPFLREVFEVRERTLGWQSTDTEVSAHNLSSALRRSGRIRDALPLASRVLQSRIARFGWLNDRTLSSAREAAELFSAHGAPERAAHIHENVLRARVSMHGVKDPRSVSSLSDLAATYLQAGRLDLAAPAFSRLMSLIEEGEYGTTLAFHARGNFLVFLLKSNRFGEAVDVMTALDERFAQWRDVEIIEAGRMATRRHLLDDFGVGQSFAISAALVQSEPGLLSRLAYNRILRWKQTLAQRERLAALLQARSPDEALAKSAAAARQARDALSAAVRAARPEDEVDAALADVERTETELMRIVERLAPGLERTSVQTEHVGSALGPDEALVEYRIYDRFDFDRVAFAEQRLAAVVVRRGAPPRIVDLGETSVIFEVAVAAVQIIEKAAAERRSSFPVAMRFLDLRLVRPLLPHLEGVERLVIAPDSQLFLVPFAALQNSDGDLLIERYDLGLVQAGARLPTRSRASSGEGLVAFGAIDFGSQPAGTEAQSAGRATPSPTCDAAVEQSGEPTATIGFAPLPCTDIEVARIASEYALERPDEPTPRILEAGAATERALKALDGPPRVLHLATHGFYREDEALPGRPLLQSGIALAGANRALAGEVATAADDGILYALEALSLPLQGTELVVVSACETAQGSVDYSEGVEGIARALLSAGAANALVTLWNVPDRATSIFMQQFYIEWLLQGAASDPAAALQATQLEFARSPDPALSDPDVWAAFVMFEG